MKPKPDPLTPYQREIYEFIAAYIKQHGVGPTHAEIIAGTSIKGSGEVFRVVVALENFGLLTRLRNNEKQKRSTKRGIALIETHTAHPVTPDMMRAGAAAFRAAFKHGKPQLAALVIVIYEAMEAARVAKKNRPDRNRA